MSGLLQDKKIVIIGANAGIGSMTRYAIEIFSNRICEIADNDNSKKNRRLGKYTIKSVDYVIGLYGIGAFYVLATLKKHTSLENQLERYGLIRSTHYEYLFCLEEVYNPNKYAWYRRINIKNGMYYPTRLRLELSSFCNLQCVYCRYHSVHFRETQKGCNKNLTMGLLRKIIDEAKEWGTVSEILNVQKGEMFCNPEWYLMLKYIKSEMTIDRFHFSTNGMLLNKKNVDLLMSIGFNKLVIVISLDGQNEEDNNRLRIGANFNVVKENIDYLLKCKNESTEVLIQNTQFLTNENYINYIDGDGIELRDDNYLKCVFGNSVEINTYAALATRDKDIDEAICRNESVSLKRAPIRTSVEGCILPLCELSVDSEGYVVVCGCEPCGEYYRLGNVSKTRLIDIWNNEYMNSVRRYYRDGLEVPLCKRCISNAMEEVGSQVYVVE